MELNAQINHFLSLIDLSIDDDSIIKSIDDLDKLVQLNINDTIVYYPNQAHQIISDETNQNFLSKSHDIIINDEFLASICTREPLIINGFDCLQIATLAMRNRLLNDYDNNRHIFAFLIDAASSDISHIICDADLRLITGLDDLRDAVREAIYQDDILYYSNAMAYLKDNDVSLRESLSLANEFGYSLSNLSSEMLATLHYQQSLFDALEAL